VGRAAVIADPALPIDGAAARVIGERVRRRVMREPVAYILGRQAFRRIELAVDSRVLIPRPETELLVEVASSLPLSASVHDVGTGSGAIALALKDERPDLAVSGSDVSADALAVARANASRLGMEVELGAELRSADLVVGNLPYVREDEWAGLQREIREYEPRLALVSGADGLNAIRGLVTSLPAGRRVALEHAPAQAEAVRGLLSDAETLKDLARRDRVTLGSVP
jgi:release factor glutamine methyltransferase